MALDLIPLVLNWPYATRAGDYAARDWAHNLLMSVEPYGVLFTNGDNDTFPLWYLQEVEGIRRDVTVVVWSYLNTPWYAKQIRDLTTPCAEPSADAEDPTRIICQRVFEAEAAPDFYGPLANYPTTGILPLTDEEIDNTTAYGYVQLPTDVVFEARDLSTRMPAGTYLPSADQFLLTIIKQAWGDRPIYFAGTTNVHRKLGLDARVARQGVAYKMLTAEEAASVGMLPMPQDQQYSVVYGAYLDVPRTRALLYDVFIYRDLLEKSYWTDEATRGIPTYYAYAHIALAQARQMLGEEELVERNMRRMDAWMELAER